MRFFLNSQSQSKSKQNKNLGIADSMQRSTVQCIKYKNVLKDIKTTNVYHEMK